MNWATFRSLVHAEARTLLRSLSFWFYVGFSALLCIYFSTLSSSKGNWLDVLMDVVRNLTFFQLPLFVWLASPMLVKTVAPTRDWLWATSLEAPTLIAAQALVLFGGAIVNLVICTALSLIVFSWTHQFLAWSTSLDFWLYTLALLLPFTFFEVLLAFSLAAIFRRTLLAVSVVVVFSVSLLLGLILPEATLFSLLNYPLLFLRLDPVVGPGAEGPLLAGFLTFYPCVGMGLIAGALLVWSRVDARCGWQPRQRGWVIVPLIVGLTGSLVAGWFHQRAATQSTVPAPVTDQLDVWRVLKAGSEAQIVGGEIEVEQWLELQNLSSQPLTSTVLSLNTGLQVSQASANEQPVQIVREGETIRLIHPNDPVAPQEVIRLALTYSGRPRLLREDYASVQYRRLDLEGRTILKFSRPVRTYLDENTVFLQRDGDWRAWPLTRGPHVAIQDEIRLSLLRRPTLVSSGKVIQQGDDQVTYLWRGALPQFLVAAADYRTIQTAEGTVYAPPTGLERDIERARLVLRTRRFLAEWLPDSVEASYAAVIPPYAQEVVPGAGVLTLPAHAYIPSAVQESFYSEKQWATRGLRLSVIQALLAEWVRWPSPDWRVEGQSLSGSAECTYTDGQANCIYVSTALPSPQAPQGRLTEDVTPPPLLQAWSIVLESRLTEAVSEAAEELNFWAAAQEGDLQAHIVLSQRGLLPRGVPGLSYTQNVARYVNELNKVLDTQGNQALVNMLRELQTAYPLQGSETLTEEAFSNLLQRYSEP